MFTWALWMSCGGDLKVYWDQPSAILVVGGAIFVTLSSVMLGQFLSFFRVMKNTVLSKTQTVGSVIQEMVKLSEIARRDGVLALENQSKETPDPFLANGLRLVVDGVEAADIEAVMNSELEAMDARHATGKRILDLLAKYAPAFGMIGTLVGLVAMLKNMDDPKKIGPGMAVALLTTLYGAILANMLLLPLADKLSLRNEQEVLIRTVIIKGLLSIQAGDNPRVTQARLSAYLTPRERADMEKQTQK